MDDYRCSVAEMIKEFDLDTFSDCEIAIANLAYGFGIPMELQLFLFYRLYSTLKRVLNEAHEANEGNTLSIVEVSQLTSEMIKKWEETVKSRDIKSNQIDNLIRQVWDFAGEIGDSV